VTSDDRRRLTILVTASTKLATAASLVREATVDVARSGLYGPDLRESMRAIAADVDALFERLSTAVDQIEARP